MRRFIHSRTGRRGAVVVTVSALLAGVASVVVASPAVAFTFSQPPVTYYVATTGSDTAFNNTSNGCTFSPAPCLTVQHAVNVASGLLTGSVTDATVSIAAGTYPEAVNVPAVPAGDSLSLVGAGASSTTINASGTNTSAITVNGGTVNITGLTVTGGNANFGGGIYNNSGTLSVSGSTISGNTATYYGGGIYNYSGGTVTVSGSTISGNTASKYGGGIYNDDGGTVSVSGSTISGNTANFGGGILNNSGGTLTVSGSTISGNTATYGGSIFNNSGGTVSVSGSTISGNTAHSYGGSIYNSGTMTVSGSTISGNTAESYGGGGIYNSGGGKVTVSGSILSGDDANGAPQECSGSGTVPGGGYNVTSDNTCGFGATSKVSTVAAIGLGSLAANGSTGPFTEAISSTSSAHQVVPVAHCAATDERGLPRPGVPGASACDAGAFELQLSVQSQTITFSPTSPAVYGSSATLGAMASSGLAVTYTVEASSTSVCTISGSTVTYIGVGSCVIDANQGGNSAFSAAPQHPGTVTVTPAALTVTGPSPSVAYGQPIPALNPTYSGFVNGDTAASLSTAATCTTTATSTSVPGTYPVTCSGAVDANYTITYTPGSTVTVTKAPTTTTLTVTPNPPAVNQATTLTATVHYTGSGVAPTGQVFFYDGSTLLGPATVQPDGTATLTTTFGGGGHSITAVYGGDTNYTGSTSTPPTPLTVACTTVITGTHASFTAGPGTTCVLNATITGGISVPRGSTLDVENSTVQGSISAGSPAGIRICGSTLSSFAVTGATGYVRVGDPANNCAPNTITGGLTAANNTGGGTISGNTIGGSTTITNNTPPFTATGNHH